MEVDIDDRARLPVSLLCLLAALLVPGVHARCSSLVAYDPPIYCGRQLGPRPRPAQPTVFFWIFKLSQTDAACPAARDCPGRVGIVDICSELLSNDVFACSSTWSDGAAGTAMHSSAYLAPAIERIVPSMCGDCSTTLLVTDVQDSSVREA